MIASVHLADVGVASALAITRKVPPAGSIAGLRHAQVALAAPLGGSILPSPQFGRAGLIAFWDGDDPLDRFLGDHPLAAKFSSGWHVRLAPLPRLRQLAWTATRHPDRTRRRLRRSRRRAHARSPPCEPADPFPAHECESRSERRRGSRPHLGDRPGPSTVARRDLFAVGLDAGAVDIRLWAPRPGPPGRDRDGRSEAVSPPAGIHPLPSLRLAWTAAGAESAGVTRWARAGDCRDVMTGRDARTTLGSTFVSVLASRHQTQSVRAPNAGAVFGNTPQTPSRRLDPCSARS